MVEKDDKALSTEVKREPPKTINEAIRLIASLLLDPPKERLPAFVPLMGYQMYDIELSLLREAAYDINRDKEKRPLSQVAREATLLCQMGKGKYHMLLGNLAIGGLSGGEETEQPRFTRNM